MLNILKMSSNSSDEEQLLILIELSKTRQKNK